MVVVGATGEAVAAGFKERIKSSRSLGLTQPAPRIKYVPVIGSCFALTAESYCFLTAPGASESKLFVALNKLSRRPSINPFKSALLISPTPRTLYIPFLSGLAKAAIAESNCFFTAPGASGLKVLVVVVAGTVVVVVVRGGEFLFLGPEFSDVVFPLPLGCEPSAEGPITKPLPLLLT